MQTSDRGLLALIRHEGVVPGPYLDVKDVWTFGIGHTAAAGPPDPARMPRGMPAHLDAGIREAFRMFRADLAAYEAEVRRAVKVPLEPHEFDALVRVQRHEVPGWATVDVVDRELPGHRGFVEDPDVGAEIELRPQLLHQTRGA